MSAPASASAAGPAPTPGGLVSQPTLAPTAKWWAATGSGGAALVVIYLARLAHITLTPEEAGAVVLAASAVAGWVKRNHPGWVPGNAAAAPPAAPAAGRHLDRNGDGVADQ